MPKFALGTAVQYYSTSHACWLDTVVDSIRPTGEIQVCCKAGYWMTEAEQAQRLRLPPGPAVVTADAPVSPKGPPAATAAAAAAPPTPTAAARPDKATPPPQQEPWSTDQAIALGAHVTDGFSWAEVIDKSVATSVHFAVEQLCKGAVKCSGQFCVAYSASSHSYYLLYRRGCKEKALGMLVNQFREVSASRAALQEELTRARDCAKTSGVLEAKLKVAEAASAEKESALLKEQKSHAQLKLAFEEQGEVLRKLQEEGPPSAGASTQARDAAAEHAPSSLQQDLAEARAALAAEEARASQLDRSRGEEAAARAALEDALREALCDHEVLRRELEEARKAQRAAEASAVLDAVASPPRTPRQEASTAAAPPGTPPPMPADAQEAVAASGIITPTPDGGGKGAPDAFSISFLEKQMSAIAQQNSELEKRILDGGGQGSSPPPQQSPEGGT